MDMFVLIGGAVIVLIYAILSICLFVISFKRGKILVNNISEKNGESKLNLFERMTKMMSINPSGFRQPERIKDELRLSNN